MLVNKLYALDSLLPEMKKPDKPMLLKVMEGHILAETQLIGSYEKQR